MRWGLLVDGATGVLACFSRRGRRSGPRRPVNEYALRPLTTVETPPLPMVGLRPVVVSGPASFALVRTTTRRPTRLRFTARLMHVTSFPFRLGHGRTRSTCDPASKVVQPRQDVDDGDDGACPTRRPSSPGLPPAECAETTGFTSAPVPSSRRNSLASRTLFAPSAAMNRATSTKFTTQRGELSRREQPE